MPACRLGRPGSFNSRMFKLSLPAIFLFLAVAVAGCAEDGLPDRNAEMALPRPNILLIVADDLGYSDVGAFGSEIATPNIDTLAAEGIMLTQFHVSPNCGPTRGAMMTGVDPHRAGMGGNHGANAANQEGQPGYVAALGEVVLVDEALGVWRVVDVDHVEEDAAVEGAKG